jgi:hypothetical protein
MRVAVLGSWREEDLQAWKLRGTREAFREACSLIGAEIVARGHSLIVGSASPKTADGAALQGALEYLQRAGVPVDMPRILITRPSASTTREENTLRQMQSAMPGLLVDYPVDASSWAAVKLVQTQLADALILVGGAEKTEQAGLTAAVSKKPLACIGSFGGAAYALNERFFRAPTLWGYDPTQTHALLQMQVPFGDHVLKEALKRAWIEGAPKLMIIHGRSKDRDLLKQYLSEYSGSVIVLADEYGATEPIPIKFERFASSVDGAIALVTPDDFGGSASLPDALGPRARENVWVEVGWFWGRRGRSKLLLMTKGSVSIPSDLGGVEHVQYQESPLEELAERTIQRFISRLRSASDTES